MINSNTKSFLAIALFFLTCLASSAQNVRGFYLSGIGTWLGHTTDENAILAYAQGNGFNYIAFYDLGSVNFSSSTEKNQLASFISRGRTQYGIAEFGAVVETAADLSTNIIPYNNGRSNADERFNVVNQEFEFWVNSSISNSYCSKFLHPAGYSCDTAGAFAFAYKEFKKIDSLCAHNSMISEYYFGWPNLGQMQKIAALADRILLHAYRPDDSDVYAYSKNRLKDIASLNVSKKVLPIFSSEPSFMKSWLNTHPQTRPYSTYSSDLSNETSTFKQYINLQGYQWFTYDDMPKTMLASASISTSGPVSFCQGGSVTLTANSGSAYLWLPGLQTTRSITVTNPGSYTVAVTASNGVAVTSSAVVVSYSSGGASQPTVTASGPVSFCPGGNVTLTSTSASSYQWSNGATTRAITVASSGSYTVTAGTGSCLATSSPMIVNAASTATTPTISTVGSTHVCPGTPVILSSSAANGYLWSNGATTRSIIVSAAGNYSVNAYSGTNCSALSATVSVSLLSAPSTPIVSAGSSTTLTSSNSSVKLSASSCNAYLWSTNATTRDITVSSQGVYRVTSVASNGCTAVSAPITIKANGCTPPAVPVISLSGSPVITTGQTLTLTSSLGSGYRWSTGSTSRSITVSTAGTYNVRVYNAGYCYSTSLNINVLVVAAREKGSDISATDNTSSTVSSITVFPNPASDFINLYFNSGSEKKFSLQLIDLAGRIISDREIDVIQGDNNIRIDVSTLTKGIYFARLMNNDEKNTLKVIVE